MKKFLKGVLYGFTAVGLLGLAIFPTVMLLHTNNGLWLIGNAIVLIVIFGVIGVISEE